MFESHSAPERSERMVRRGITNRGITRQAVTANVADSSERRAMEAAGKASQRRRWVTGSLRRVTREGRAAASDQGKRDEAK